VNVVATIENLLTLCTLSDPEAQEFWKTSFDTQVSIDFDTFNEKLTRLFNFNLAYDDYALIGLIFSETTNKQKVSIDRFSLVLKWFGPIKIDDDFILARILELCKKEWFFGDITREKAEEILKNSKQSPSRRFPFLVRLSLPDNGKDVKSHPVTITYLKEGKKNRYFPTHVQVIRETDNEDKYVCNFLTDDGQEIHLEDQNLSTVIESAEEILNLVPVEANSKYKRKILLASKEQEAFGDNDRYANQNIKQATTDNDNSSDQDNEVRDRYSNQNIKRNDDNSSEQDNGGYANEARSDRKKKRYKNIKEIKQR
jgi:hypothetical protein